MQRVLTSAPLPMGQAPSTVPRGSPGTLLQAILGAHFSFNSPLACRMGGPTPPQGGQGMGVRGRASLAAGYHGEDLRLPQPLGLAPLHLQWELTPICRT